MIRYKGTALFMVIVISLIIGIICSSLILSSYFFRLQFQKQARWTRLERNLFSGVNMILASSRNALLADSSFNLYSISNSPDPGIIQTHFNDSLTIRSIPWGVFKVGTVRSFVSHDTLFRAFTYGYVLDTLHRAAFYLADEDRPVSVSGYTQIKGNAYLPKAGIVESFVGNKKYSGPKSMVLGSKFTSGRKLPHLDSVSLISLVSQIKSLKPTDTSFSGLDSLTVSFFRPPRIIRISKKANKLSNLYLSGNIMLVSDSLLRIDSTVHLNNVLVFAKSIFIQKGFWGRAQFFAQDSIIIGKKVSLNYPSCLGVISLNSKLGLPPRIAFDNNDYLEGTAFIYQKDKKGSQAFLDFGKNFFVHGFLYVPGMARFRDSSVINGSLYANRLMFLDMGVNYENYLIDSKLDYSALSPYFINGSIFPWASKRKKKVLEWIESR